MGMYALSPTLITHRENATIAFEIAKSLGYDGTVENKRKLLTFLKTTFIDAIIVLKLESLFFNVIDFYYYEIYQYGRIVTKI